MTTIRLLHISDLHVSNFLNLRQVSKDKLSAVASALQHFTFAPAYSQGKLTRFLAFLRGHTETLDGIIITGDIATTGRSFDLDKAFDIVNNRITPMGVDLGLLPGNHDRWVPHFKGKLRRSGASAMTLAGRTFIPPCSGGFGDPRTYVPLQS